MISQQLEDELRTTFGPLGTTSRCRTRYTDG